MYNRNSSGQLTQTCPALQVQNIFKAGIDNYIFQLEIRVSQNLAKLGGGGGALKGRVDRREMK